MARYRLSDEAAADLDRLYSYGIQNFGLQKADAYFDSIVSRFQVIAEKPRRYPSVAHIRAGYRRSVIGSHAIYYRTENDGVLIVRLLGHQDPDRNL